MNSVVAEIDAQYRLLREEAGTVPGGDQTVLELSGAESAEFLQGQLTNDIEALEPGAGCYAALLDRKGKMQSDMQVLCLEPGRIWVLTPASTADLVERHLTMYKVGREVEIGRVALDRLELIGPRTPELIGSPLGAEHDHAIRRLAETDVRVVASDAGAALLAEPGALEPVAAMLAQSGAEIVSREAAEILRVERGRPAFGIDIPPGTIPQEANLNARAVNFEKGCYIGQETVARLHYKGKPNRHLRRLTSAQPLTTGARVALGDRDLGEVGTAVLSPARGPLALAILRREAEPGTEVEVAGHGTAVVEAIEAEADPT